MRDRLETWASADGAAPAVVAGDHILSRAGLLARADELAARLGGVAPGERVAVALPRQPDTVAWMLACWQRQAVWVPIDTTLPAARRQSLITDAGARMVVDEAGLHPGPGGDPLAGDPAYLIYTSGSTGTPKGVLVPHRALAAACAGIAETYHLRHDDRCLQFAGLGFDVAIEEIATAVWSGATLVLRDEACLAGYPAFLAAVAGWGITVLNLPTAFWHGLVEAMAHHPDLRLPRRVRLVVVGGEAMQAAHLRRWQTLHGGHVRLLNAYGPTEATITATVWDATPTLASGAAIDEVPIGRCLPGVAARVLRSDGSCCDDDEPGELHLAGPQLALGYHQRPEATAAAFVPAPAHWTGQQRMYRTGDRCRRRGDGLLVHLGRIDAQVKIRGHRIELGEVEAALAAQTGVAAAAVALRDGRLCAWVVERTPVRHAELARALALMLPVAAVPQAWMTVAQLPCTANGKLDRTALPDPPRTPSGAPPQPGRETLLTAAWCEALGLEQLGRDDPVRWWGADSLSALAVSVRLAERHGLAIPAQRLLATATVAEQAVLLETIAPAATLPPAANILASRQQVDWLDRAWFLHATGQPVPPFTAALTLRLSGHLDPDRLATALTAVVQSEPVLRTVFPLRPLPPRWLRPLLRWYTSLPRVARAGWRRLLAQRTPAAWPGRELPASPVPLPVTSGGLDDLPQTTAALAAAIDPHRGPLVAAHLTRLGAERHAFSLVFSHLAFDGGSAQTLLDRLWAAYRGEPLTPPAPSYRDWAAWDRTRTPSLPPETLAHLETVMRRWGPWPRLHLPSFARMATPCWRLAVRTLGADVLTPLRRLAAQARATPFQVLLAAYAVALRRITGHAEVAVTIATANRTHPQMLDRIGMFLTTGVVAVRLDADATCASVLPHVTASVERALAVQELTALDQAALGRAALPEAGALTGYFDVYAPLRVDPGIAGLDAEELDVVEPEPVEPHVVSALAVIQPRGLRLRLAHAADRLEPAIADRVLDAWVDALTAVG